MRKLPVDSRKMTATGLPRSRGKAETSFRYLPVSDGLREWGMCVASVGYSRIPAGHAHPPTRPPAGTNTGWSSTATAPGGPAVARVRPAVPGCRLPPVRDAGQHGEAGDGISLFPQRAALHADQNTAFFRIFPPFLRILPAKLILVVGLWPGATSPYNGTSVFHAKSLFVPWGAC